jgi:hypothetical protein
MSNENNNDSGNLGTIGFVLFFVGIYMFLFGLIRAKATSGFTVFFGGLTVLLIELLGVCVIYVACSSEVFLKADVLYAAFTLSCIGYIALLIKAHHEDKQY